MYSLAEIRRGISNPYKIQREVNRNVIDKLIRRDGIAIFDQEWDNLIILDACRYDFFESRNSIPGRLSKAVSKGAATPEWIRANFAGQQFYDTVYVAANGWYDKLRDEIQSDLHAYIGVYSKKYREASGAVPPEVVTDHALEAATANPDKRLVIHYTQPHAPYMGETGEAFPQEAKANLHEMLKRAPDAGLAELRQAYAENLDIVLEETERLIENLSGKSVISADHGELLGERHWRLPLRDVGHPAGVHVKPLVEVPWLECPTDERRTITAEKPESGSHRAPNDVEEHLQELGYL